MRSGGIFDFDHKQDRLAEVELELTEPDVWNDPEAAKTLNRERSQLEQIVKLLATLQTNLVDLSELAELAAEENDADSLDDVQQEVVGLEKSLAEL